MADEWAIASLSQVIDEDDDDDDDVLIPPTPGQEDIDISTPSQDSASLLGAMSDSHPSGRRKLHTLSLGLPDDPESEGLPFLALEWDPQFPPTPAPENGQSTESYFASSKGKDDTNGSKIPLTNESCNGQSSVWEGCSTSWLTRGAEASAIRTISGGSGDKTSSKDKKEISEGTKREEKNIDDRGGGGSKASGIDRGGGDGSGDEGNGDDEDEDRRKRTKDSGKEEEESSHEPSSDSSEGSMNVADSHSQKADSEKIGGDEELCLSSKSHREEDSSKDKFGEGEDTLSQRDMFSSQTECSKVAKKLKKSDFEELDDRGDPVALTPSDVSLVPLSKAEDGRPPTSYRRLYGDVPLSSSSLPPPMVDIPSASPPKRKLSDNEDVGSSEIPFKLPRMDESSGSNEFCEDKIYVDYPALTKKDVEISPKEQHPHSRVMKALQFSSASKHTPFNIGDDSTKSKSKERLYTEEMSEDLELPSLSHSEADDGTYTMSKQTQHHMDTEDSDTDAENARKQSKNTAEDMDIKDVSDKDDSDVEIIEDKDRSIEVLYEKPKVQKSYFTDEVGSQDFNLMLSGTQCNSPSEDHDKKCSEEQIFSGESVSQPHSQSPLHISNSEDLRCPERIMSSGNKEGYQETENNHNTIPATQMEEICQPALVSQPDIDSLISLPITGSSESRNQSGSRMVGPSLIEDYEQTEETQASQESQTSVSAQKIGIDKARPNEQSIMESSVTRLQMPDILTPSTQDLMVVHESDSLFVKAANAVKERGEQVEKRIEEKSSGSNGDVSLECVEMPVDDHDASSNKIKVTPVSGSQKPLSSQVTPVLGPSHHVCSPSTKLFASCKNVDVSNADLQSSKILAEESDSDEEGRSVRKRKRLRAKGLVQQAESHVQSSPAIKGLIKSSTPNTSQGISPNISAYGGSDIDKDPHVSVMTETSKSHESTPEQVVQSSKSPDSMMNTGTGASTQDIEALMGLDSLLSVDELRKSGYKERSISIQGWEYKNPLTNKVFIIIKDPVLEFRHPVTNENCFVVCEKEQGIVSKMNLRQILDSGGSTHGANLRRMSDVSLLSRTSSSSGSGYLADKSSSSGSSHRMSMYSTTESTRLSIGSVVTLPSPPRENRDKELELARRRDDGYFAVPTVSARNYQSGKVGATSVTLDEGKNIEKANLLQKDLLKEDKYSSTSTSDDVPSVQEKKRRGRGRGRGSASRGKPVDPSVGQSRGRGKGRGKGRGRGRERRSSSEDTHAEFSGNEDIPVISTKEQITLAKPSSPRKRKNSEISLNAGETGENISLPGMLKSLPENVRQLIENSQAPLSEEEEEVFFHMGADQERQMAQVLKRVREIDLKPGLLVFARFVDNNFYSALLKERDGTNRWHVQFTLDRHDASVRDVYVLPTDILPRGHLCLVKDQTEQFNDLGVVRGHVREGSTLFHIIETDRGNTERVLHSHIFLTELQAKELLSARHHFRSMVASPGRDVSLDNIVAGTRRRTPSKLSSPHSRKADENLDSSESAMGEFDEMVTASIYSPSSKKTPSRARKGIKKQDLSVLREESESELDTCYAPSTPKSRKRAGSSRTSRTPKSTKTEQKVELTSAANTSEAKPHSSTTEAPQPVNVEELCTKETPKTPLKKRGRHSSQIASTQAQEKLPKLEEETLIDPRLGPFPPADSQMFAGFEILLTSGESSLRKRQSPEEGYLPPFDKDHLKSQIIIGGGKVIESYTDAEIILAQQGKPLISKQTPKSKKTSDIPGSTVLLVSNTHCRTSSYIQCLAAGIPIVSFQWVINSCNQGRYIDWRLYLLPSGENEYGETMEQSLIPEEGFLSGPPPVFEGELVFLATSTNKEFTSLWQPILTMAGADVRVRPAKTGNLSRVLVKAMTVVVADATIPEKELLRAQQLNIPVVTTEWVIQSLIVGKRLGYSESPKFIHESHGAPGPSKTEEK
ncbi:TP53-binding protein 1-like isoform X2 [Palaemon carinicauda]